VARPDNYHTKQREAILNYIASLKDDHVTAAQIAGHFAAERTPVGRTTVYRHLDKLAHDGKVRKYTADGVPGACYQYVASAEDCHGHLHLQCELCGELQHLECDKLSEIQQHVLDSHGFEVNALRTVLYGRCGHCSQNV
jgi:Fur family ferric uptake transcriptional regulator